MRSLISNKYLWSLTLGHFTIDLYSGAMPVVLLYLSISLGLTIEQVGLVAGIYSICSSVSQPIFGLLSDRYGGRWLATGGLLWMSILQGLVGFLPSYAMLLLVAPLAGFGSAAFHPPSASSANRTSGDKKTAGMAIFLLGGNGGFAVGPLAATWVIGGLTLGSLTLFPGLGLHGTAVISLFGLIIAPILFVLSGRHQPVQTAVKTQASSGGRVEFNRAFTRLAIIALLVVMTLRAWSQSSTSLYVPQFFTTLGGLTISESSNILFIFSAVLAAGSLFGGFLSDRIGGRTVMVVSFLLAAPASYVLFAVPGVNYYLAAAVLGFATGAAWPPTLVMAQELFPRHAGVASGLALGFVFGMGGIGNIVTGFIAERTGLLTAMILVSGLPLLAALCTLALPTHRAVAKAAYAARAPADSAVDSTIATAPTTSGR